MISAIHRLVEHPAFQHVIIAFIALGGVLAGLETSPALVGQHGAWLRGLDQAVLGVFALEAVLKMAAHGRRPWRYFADGWNVFDFLILVACLLPEGGPFAAVLRLTRALRLLRLVSALPKLQLLVGALLKSLSAMGYVSLLLGLLFYVYAVTGTHFFGPSDPKHFGSLGASLFTLFRIVTLDNWGDIFLNQLAHAHAFTVASYFVTFIILGTMIILNLFIGIIMNSMSEVHAEIAERDRLRAHPMFAADPWEEELVALEAELKVTQARVARLRRQRRTTNVHDTPTALPANNNVPAPPAPPAPSVSHEPSCAEPVPVATAAA